MKETSAIKEPIAKKIPHKIEAHGHVRTDDYYWLNQREDPATIDYLNEENAYREAIMADTEDFQKLLFEEMVGRIKKDDSSVPYKLDGWFYYTRFEGEKEYPFYCRREESMDAPEQIMLDVNELAAGKSYCQVAGISVSPSKKIIAFGLDTVGRRVFTIHFKNLETGEILAETIENTTGGATWAADNTTLFYSRKNETTLRSELILKHKFGSATADEEVFFEEDETFSTYVFKSKSKEFIIIGCSSTVSDEYRYLNADAPDEEFVLFQPRERGLEYGMAHFGEHWYIRTNYQDATNFKIMRSPLHQTTKENWTDLIAHRPDVYVEGLELFQDFFVLEERTNGLTQMRIQRWDSGEQHYLDFGEETYTAYTGSNADFNTVELRYGYTSLTTPNSVIEYNMATRSKVVLKEQEVVGGYNKELYTSKRLWATAKDGTKVPISLVYKNELRKPETGNPLLIYGYGSYGITIDASFSSTRLTLLDRGFVYAIAHIRGGQYLGRQWYDDGKLLKKENTFTDFIACAEFLIGQKYTSPQQLFAMGGSAGGLLMGAIANLKPELFKGIIAAVPFVDVVTTMLDDTIPLTTGEYDEWGNPNDKAFYDCMLRYSPYDNLRAVDYPAMLITTGLHDSQVQYWEPAKWIAKLREIRSNKNKPLLLFCNMDTGHGGASGRFESYKETAMEFAFLLDLAGRTE